MPMRPNPLVEAERAAEMRDGEPMPGPMMTVEQFVESAVASGKFFTVDFIKRTTGEPRTMNCRCGVAKHLAGGELAYDAAKRRLLPVYDVRAEGYRQIPLDGLVSVKMEGIIWRWTGQRLEAAR